VKRPHINTKTRVRSPWRHTKRTMMVQGQCLLLRCKVAVETHIQPVEHANIGQVTSSTWSSERAGKETDLTTMASESPT
jgi:hypothetical protein